MDSTERGETEVTEAQNPTYAQKLSAGENLWAWKLGLRAILLVVAVIGIGCIAWATSTALSNVDQDEFSEFFDDLGVPWGLITVRHSSYFFEINTKNAKAWPILYMGDCLHSGTPYSQTTDTCRRCRWRRPRSLAFFDYHCPVRRVLCIYYL